MLPGPQYPGTHHTILSALLTKSYRALQHTVSYDLGHSMLDYGAPLFTYVGLLDL